MAADITDARMDERINRIIMEFKLTISSPLWSSNLSN